LAGGITNHNPFYGNRIKAGFVPKGDTGENLKIPFDSLIPIDCNGSPLSGFILIITDFGDPLSRSDRTAALPIRFGEMEFWNIGLE